MEKLQDTYTTGGNIHTHTHIHTHTYIYMYIKWYRHFGKQFGSSSNDSTEYYNLIYTPEKSKHIFTQNLYVSVHNSIIQNSQKSVNNPTVHQPMNK